MITALVVKSGSGAGYPPTETGCKTELTVPVNPCSGEPPPQRMQNRAGWEFLRPQLPQNQSCPWLVGRRFPQEQQNTAVPELMTEHVVHCHGFIGCGRVLQMIPAVSVPHCPPQSFRERDLVRHGGTPSWTSSAQRARFWNWASGCSWMRPSQRLQGSSVQVAGFGGRLGALVRDGKCASRFSAAW